MGKGKAPAGVLRKRKLIREGWLRRLTPSESKVWDVLNDCANEDGISYPGARLIADRTGLLEKNIFRYRRRLIDRGLLRIVEDGGGRGHALTVQLVFPNAKPPQNPLNKPPQKTPSKPPQIEGVYSEETPSGRDAKPPQGATDKPPQGATLLNKEEESIEESMKTDRETAVGRVTNDLGPSEGEMLDSEIREFIARSPNVSGANVGRAGMQAARDLVKAVGWTRAERYVDRACSAGKGAVAFQYALGIYKGELMDGKHQQAETPKQRAARLAAEMAEEAQRSKARTA